LTEPASLAPQFAQPIGALLLERDLATAADIDKALALQSQYHARLGAILVRTGALSEDVLLPVLASQSGIRFIGQDGFPPEATEILSTMQSGMLQVDWFMDQKVAVWGLQDGSIQCACRNPIDSYLQETLSGAFATHRLCWGFARAQDVEAALKMVNGYLQGDQTGDAAHLRELAEEAPVIELVNHLLAQAIDENASDIHLEPDERAFAVRFRIDGILHHRSTLPREQFDAVASRIKLISGADIAERRLPQDGRISTRAGGKEMDVRVSCVPSVHGESIVLRLLHKERGHLDFASMGMEKDHLRQLMRLVTEPHGILLVTGPTGSGKSTSLYTALAAINDGSRKLITVEDPVEYQMPGVIQIQTLDDIGYSFACALRAILRQDPDVIMIGEIRDLETAEIAIQSALTGHLVFSTLHTNDCLSTFTRLTDMGVEPFLVGSAIRAVQAQRLVRKLCARCSVPTPPHESVVKATKALQVRYAELFAGESNWRAAVGCTHCRGTGYSGRVGIFELLELDPLLQAAILRADTATAMLPIARRQGYRTLREDGLIKAWRGVTTADEVFRVTGLEEWVGGDGI